MGSGTSYGTPDSGTESKLNDQTNSTRKRSSMDGRQSAALNRIMQLLKTFNRDLKEYVNYYIDKILSSVDISISLPLKIQLSQYQIRITQIESKLNDEVLLSANHEAIISELQTMKDDLQDMYQGIENTDSAIKEYWLDTARLLDESETVQNPLTVITSYINTHSELHKVNLNRLKVNRLKAAFNQYELAQNIMLKKQETRIPVVEQDMETSSIPSVSEKQPEMPAKLSSEFQLHQNKTLDDLRDKIAEEKFESTLAAHGSQEQGPVMLRDQAEMSLEELHRLLERVNNLLKQANTLHTEVEGWSHIVLDVKESGLDIEAVQNVFKEQLNHLGEFREKIEEENRVSDLSVPNLINQFAFSITSLYEKISIGASLWHGHFELSTLPIPTSLSRLEKEIDRIGALCANKWREQWEQPSWDIHTLLDAIHNMFFYQQCFVFKQTMFFAIIRTEGIILHRDLVKFMPSFNIDKEQLYNQPNEVLDTVSVYSELTSASSRFFGHSRDSSQTSVGSVLATPEKPHNQTPESPSQNTY